MALPLTVLVSSMSARGRSLRVGPRVCRILRSGGWHVDVRVTTSDHDPSAVAASVSTRYVAALGGDGYLAAIAQGLAGTGAVMVPIPGGRGNDWCRAIGAGPEPVARAEALAPLGAAPPEQAASRIRPMDGMWVDEGFVGEDGDGDARGGDDDGAGRDGAGRDGRSGGAEALPRPRRLALGVVSLGLDAWANKLANESNLRSGPLAYGWGAVTSPAHFHGAPFRARIDGAEQDLPGWVFSVSNSGFIGGGVHVVPSSDPSDGVLELFRVDQVPLRRVVPAVVQVVALRHADHPLVHTSPARSVDILGPAGLPAMADGDVIGHLPLHVEVAPGVVRVLL